MGGRAYLCTLGAADGTLHEWVNVFLFRHQLKHWTLMDPVCLWINIFSKLSISRMESTSYKRIIMPFLYLWRYVLWKYLGCLNCFFWPHLFEISSEFRISCFSFKSYITVIYLIHYPSHNSKYQSRELVYIICCYILHAADTFWNVFSKYRLNKSMQRFVCVCVCTCALCVCGVCVCTCRVQKLMGSVFHYCVKP